MSMQFLPEPSPVLLDYSGAEQVADVLGNLSGVVAAGDRLWTVSDEGRSFECLEREGAGYRLIAQTRPRDRLSSMPSGHEADLEGLDLVGDRLWLCGSHCRVRLPREPGGAPVAKLRDRPSRHLLGTIAEGGAGRARALPFSGKGSLREALAKDEFLRDFIDLPSKENGLDIEGLAVLGERLFLGLRGPLIDSHAVILEFPLDKDHLPRVGRYRRHFVWLDGLGVRDLASDGGRLLVVAGPVSAAAAPFQLHGWVPGAAEAPCLGRWREADGRPEGLCRLECDGRVGMLTVYDGSEGRIDGSLYRADWFPV